jgi:SAM-dependent methyltransferase
VVYCQQGLQFLPDAAGALREMRRVLAPDGRLAVSLWRELGRTPGFSAFVDVLDRHAGTAAGDMLRGPFALPNAAAVRELIEAAGFVQQRLAIHIFPVRFASVLDFFQEEVAATPLAEPIGELPEEVRARMVDDLTDALRGYLDDDGLVFPIESHIFTARV